MSNEFNKLYEFENYRLNEAERNLWRENELVPMPPKLFDTLLTLVKNGGNIVSKDDMLNAVWPGSFVEESNLSQNIYTLRQMFGREKKFIETVPRKGYRFAVPVRTPVSSPAAEQNRTPEPLNDSLPTPNAETETSTGGSKRMNQFAVGAAAFGAILLLLVVTAFWKAPQTGSPDTEQDVELKPLTDTGRAFGGAVSGDGQFVAFIETETDSRKVRLMDLKTGGVVEVPINGNAFPGMLAFSPDGGEIFFRDRGLLRAGRTVYRMPRFGGDAESVANDVWGRFSLSPDGSKIAFFREDTATNTDLLVVKYIAGGEETIHLKLKAPEQFFLPVSPSWSADSRLLAFIKRGARSEISIVDLERGTTETVQTELSKLFQIEWLPDGRSLYALSKEPNRNRQIWSVSYPEGKAVRITNDLGQYEGLAITKDGRKIVSEARTVVSNVWVMQPGDPRSAKQLTFGSYGHFALADLVYATEDRIIYDAREDIDRDLWIAGITSNARERLTKNNGTRNTQVTATADGRHIYIASNRDGTESIWRLGQDGSDPIKITAAGDETHWFPALSHDERHLYYLSRQRSLSTIRRITLDNLSEETVLEVRDFSPLHFFRISQDGKYLAFVHRSNDAEAEADETSNSPAGIRIGLLDLSNRSITTVPIRASRALVRFTEGGSSLDYILGNSIMRKSLKDPAAEPVRVLSLPDEMIFNFDWSMGETHIAVARGRNNGDLVMLTVGAE